jgi:hypothetical protein
MSNVTAQTRLRSSRCLGRLVRLLLHGLGSQTGSM